MRAADAGWLLSAIARGGRIDLPPERDELLDALRDGGLVRAAPDPGPEQKQLVRVRADLERVMEARARGDQSAELLGRERGLRSAIVELSERIAESEGAAEVRRMSAAAYRGAVGSGHRFQVTQRGRTLLSDLAPRMLRVGDASLDAFDAEMRALREAIAWRARRAGEIDQRMAARKELGAAARSAAVGLSAVRAETPRIARAFDVTFRAIRVGSAGFTAEHDAAAAESVCLAVSDLSLCEKPDVGASFARLRAVLLQEHVRAPEDALDAATLLMHVPRETHPTRLQLARELARALAQRNQSITLALALTALAGEDQIAGPLRSLLELDGALQRDVPNAMERMSVAVLLAFARRDPGEQIEKWRMLRNYLARFSPEGMAIAAALLAWVALEPAEILDDLRLVSAELTKHRVAGGGAETMSLAIKLLVGMAALAAGREGDHEERLALAPAITPRIGYLGLAGALSALPVAVGAVTAFHRTVLDAAAEWERVFHPTHSSYVYGSGRRSSGWG